jgi:hypothetical protein
MRKKRYTRINFHLKKDTVGGLLPIKMFPAKKAIGE